jgi:DNA-binding Xre family transcriptional regulator
LSLQEIYMAEGVEQAATTSLSRRVRVCRAIWNNKVGTVDLTELEKIATALGVQPGDLIVSDEQYAALVAGGQEDEVA